MALWLAPPLAPRPPTLELAVALPPEVVLVASLLDPLQATIANTRTEQTDAVS
jgi:hypothetical protein